MLDSIVVGGGPAGLYCALLLAEEGFDVAVVEEHESLGVPTHCTGIVSDELSALFKVSESLVLSRPTRCLVVAATGETFPFSSADEGIAVIDRGEFDRQLGAAAQRAGAEIKYGVRAEQIWSEPSHVRLLGSEGCVMKARTCVLAGGVAYRLHRQPGLGLPSLFLHSAQVEIDIDVGKPDSFVEVHVGRRAAPEGFAWVVPIRRGDATRAKVGIMMRGDAANHLERFLSERELADHSVSTEPTRRLLPLAPASPTYTHRVLSVGDAAGLTKPTTGGGIFYSLLSSRLAAETLAEALRDDRVSGRDLSVYEARWRLQLGSQLRISSHLRRLLTKLTDQEIRLLLEALMADDVQRLIQRTARFNWHGELIRAILRQPRIKSVLLRTLLR